jgi:hypothetical protein
MFRVDEYMQQLILSMKNAFGGRLLYVGLQGSYLRGEATEDALQFPLPLLSCPSVPVLRVSECPQAQLREPSSPQWCVMNNPLSRTCGIWYSRTVLFDNRLMRAIDDFTLRIRDILSFLGTHGLSWFVRYGKVSCIDGVA